MNVHLAHLIAQAKESVKQHRMRGDTGHSNALAIAIAAAEGVSAASMLSLQCEVGTWHVRTFGGLGTEDALLKKLEEEYTEFKESRLSEEAADIIIVLMAMANRGCVDLEEAIREKLERLKSRDQLSRDVERGIYTQEQADALRAQRAEAAE
jgi:predicted house-cleaning noncanonical NTP pyrophosphatase (MazG superfamily)